MADTAADILAPSDPVWSPPPTTGDSILNVSQPDPMLAARGVSDVPPPPPPPPPADPNMITPASAASPVSFTPPIPSEQHPNNPDLERQGHESWWRRTLDAVGTILGGDQTYKITKHPDGTMTAAYEPSTSGEKWGRVAMAALGGAAKGLANSQGPGGAARGAAAGTQYGMEMAKQNEDDVQKKILNAGQMAKLNQEIVRGAWNNSKLPEEYRQQQTDWALKNIAQMADLGVEPLALGVTDHQKLMEMGVANPLAVEAHMGKNGDMVFNQPDGKGGVNFYHIPATLANQRTTTDYQWSTYALDPKDSTKTIETKHTTRAGQDRNGERLKNQMAVDVANNKVFNDAAENATRKTNAKKSETEQQLEQAKLNYLRQFGHLPGTKEETGTGTILGDIGKAAGADVEASGESLSEQKYNPDGTPLPSDTGQTILQNLAKIDPGTAALVKRIGEYRGAEADLPRGKERAPFLKLVSQVYPGFDSKEYKARVGLLDSWRYGQLSQARQSANTLVNHMGNLYDAMTALNPSEFAGTNVAQGIGRSIGLGSKEKKDAQGKYDTAATGVASEAAKTFKGGGGGTQTETNEWRKRMDRGAPASMQLGAFNEAFDLLTGRLDSIQETMQTGFHTDQPFPIFSDHAIKTLQRIPGGQDILNKYGITQGNAPGKPSAGTPAGKPAAAGDKSWIDHPTGMEGIPTPDAPVRPGAPAAAPNNPKPQAIPGATFDATIFHNVHPDVDINKAIEQARKKGMNVINEPR